MWTQLIALTVAGALGCTSIGTANAHGRKDRHHPHVVRAGDRIAAPAPYDGPTLVMHPANNIACMTPYQSTRPLPCDQPVWVYGSPCEIDLGLGRYRTCD